MKRVWIAIVIVFAALAGVIVWQVAQPHETEPVYKGKRLSEWLKACAVNPYISQGERQKHWQEARAALGQAGTKAIPTLLRMLRAKDSSLKLKLLALAKRQHIINISFTPDDTWHRSAVVGFEILVQLVGAKQVQSAVPAVIDIAERNTNGYAIGVLIAIGPSAKEAVPMLLGWATNGVMRRTSVLALGYIHAEPDQVVPVLIESLHDPDLSVQLSALASLGDFGPEAKLAVPVLVELLNATDEYVRGDVTNALKAIDPEAAAKAGIK